MKKLKIFLTHKIWSACYCLGITSFLNDVLFTKILYWCYTGRALDLVRPMDFNEKVQWLKLYHRDKSIPECVDKFVVRERVRKSIGEKFLAESLGVYDNIEEIDFEALPKKFVLKATHASGWNVICQDKDRLNWTAAKSRMAKWLKSDFSKVGREWQYREVKPRVLCEKYIEELETGEFMDYRLFTFYGDVKYIYVEYRKARLGEWERGDEAVGSNKPVKRDGTIGCGNFYTANWEYIPNVVIGDVVSNPAWVEKPACLDEMIDAAHKLSAEFPFCRVDFYVIGGKKAVFSELTFTPGKGCYMFKPEEFGVTLGNCMTLPDRKIK